MLVLGILVAAGTIASGIVPRVTQWTDMSRVSRTTFFDIPDPVYWLFYGTVAVMLVVCAWLAAMRVMSRKPPAASRSSARCSASCVTATSMSVDAAS